MNILEINQLYKAFGRNQVLNGLDMAVPEGSIFGFVGRNGAGKTTTMKIVLGLLKADRGTVTVCGEEVSYGATKTNRHIGYLPDVPEFYGYMRPREYLQLCGEIAGLPSKHIGERSDELLSLVGLGDANRKIRGFSGGMKQRLGIAQALMGEPRLLICDEPTSALDPLGRRQILDILFSLKSRTTVVFSTHILSDVERICDRVAGLAGGRLVLSGTIAEIRKRNRSNSYCLRFSSSSTAREFAGSLELQWPAVKMDREGSTLVITTEDENGGRVLIDLLAAKQIVPESFEVMGPSLESLFAEAVQ